MGPREFASEQRVEAIDGRIVHTAKISHFSQYALYSGGALSSLIPVPPQQVDGPSFEVSLTSDWNVSVDLWQAYDSVSEAFGEDESANPQTFKCTDVGEREVHAAVQLDFEGLADSFPGVG